MTINLMFFLYNTVVFMQTTALYAQLRILIPSFIPLLFWLRLFLTNKK